MNKVVISYQTLLIGAKQLRVWLVALMVSIAGASAAQAADAAPAQTDPVAVMQAAIETVLAELKQNEALFTADPEALRARVAEAALPHLAIKRMAQLSLAKHWRSASAQQREVYLREFQRYLIRTYTKTLYLYRNTKPEMLGREGKNNKPDDTKTTLKLRVTNERGEAVILFLRLELQDAAWKIVDVNVEGISLVVTARGAFDEEINRNGLDAFLKNLTEQNNQAAAANHE